MEYSVEICKLSSAFYERYPADIYPEILRKNARPYTCLKVQTNMGYIICIPFRSSIQHDDAFLIKGSKRSEITRSGLDYKKTVLVENDLFIETAGAFVDNDEYVEVITNIEKIIRDILRYIQIYTEHKNGTKTLHPRAYSRHYKYSTLPYFHSLLGLD